MARLKCKDGDFALVIYDTPGCQQNIGKVVQVQGPARVLIQSQMFGWRIKPLFPAPWGVTQLNGSIGVEVVDWKSCIFHEDEWLMPLHPLPPEEIWRHLQVQIDQGLMELGAVTGN